MASELAIGDFPNEKVELIKKMVAKDCTNDELELFLYTCKRTGLDPLARQIYAVKIGGKMSIQTGIDGYRLIADRTGKLAGISDPHNVDAESGLYPTTASVTVKKLLSNGTVADFTATARWTEYNAGTSMWKKMPYLMLGKCAEALALRKAFPADLSGVYTTEEMAQADNAQQEQAVVAEVERQKAAYTPDPAAEKSTIVQVLTPNGMSQKHPAGADFVPPELDWSYQKTTGVLICRIEEALQKTTAKKRDYLVIKLNGTIEGQRSATYFHNSHCDDLLAAVGKICKFMVSMSKDGKFINIYEVLEIDGKHIDKAPAEDPDHSAEVKARLIASSLEWTEDDLRELYTRWAHNSWDETLAKLEARKAELAEQVVPA